MATVIEARQPIPANRKSSGFPWDDCTLELERVTDLVRTMEDLILSLEPTTDQEVSKLVTPMSLLKMEMDYLDTAIHALYPNWADPTERDLTAAERSLTVLGDHELPDELRPVPALYEKLTNAGGSTTVEAITKYFKDADIGVAGDGDDFTVVVPNLSRRGLTREYALRRLHYILRGTEPVPEGGAE